MAGLAPRLRLVTHEDIALVVTEMAVAGLSGLAAEFDEGKWDENSRLVVLARRHDAVVRAVFATEPVLPLRFGTLVADEEAAVRLLREHQGEAADRLDRVDGHREWGVRAGRTPPPRPPTENLSGADYLALRRQLRNAQTGDRLHEALTRHATEIELRRPADGLLLDAAYLVARDREDGFHAEIGRATGLQVTVTGPWPPYSFGRLATGTR